MQDAASVTASHFVLATWCAEDVHFHAPTTKSVTQSASSKTLVSASRASSAEKSEELSAAAGQVGDRDRAGSVAHSQQAHEAARLRSVAILTDYFKAVAETQKQTTAMEKGPTLSTRLFLLLCPPQPKVLERGQLSNKLNVISAKFAAILVAYGFVLLPAWLWLVRDLFRREYILAASILLWTVLVLVGLAQLTEGKGKAAGNNYGKLVSARFVTDQARERLAPLTPAPPAPRAPPPLALQPTHTPAPTPATGAQPTANGVASIASRISAAVPPLPPKGSLTDSLEATLPGQIQLVHEELYGQPTNPPVWTREVMVQQINKLCSEVGLPGLDEAADFKKMAGRLHSVKNTLGLS